MTPAQRSVYFRLWAAALKTCWTRSGKSFTRCSSDDLAVEVDGIAFAAAWQEQRGITADDLRHAAHRVALGSDKSSSKLSNRDLDRVWAMFRLLADPLNLTARLEWDHPERGARRRQENVIHTAVPEAYASHVAFHKFGTRNVDGLSDEDTEELANTLRARKETFAHVRIGYSHDQYPARAQRDSRPRQHPVLTMKLSDAQFESIKARLNSAIHELVFAVKHAEDDNLDDAATCLVTAQGTIEEVNNELVAQE